MCPLCGCLKAFLREITHASIAARGYNHARRLAVAVLLVKVVGGVGDAQREEDTGRRW
jgi:uncharacterized tellurite resistance protein B-like protein